MSMYFISIAIKNRPIIHDRIDNNSCLWGHKETLGLIEMLFRNDLGDIISKKITEVLLTFYCM